MLSLLPAHAAVSSTVVQVAAASVAPTMTPQPLVLPSVTPTASPPAPANPTPSAAPTTTPEKTVPQRIILPNRIAISADDLTYDSDRFLLIGRGNVHMSDTDGFTATARYLAMDLKADRLVIAGHIDVKTAHGEHLLGAALSLFLDVERAYYLPVVGGPDRWTYLNNDFAHPLLGREMPGDAFALPDPSMHRPFLHGHRAVVAPHRLMRFGAGMLDTEVVVVPVPTYTLNLSTNPNYAQNSLAGANYDASYPFAGSTNRSGTRGTTTALHLRESAASGLFAAVESHAVWAKSSLVDSYAPLNHAQRQINLIDTTHLSPTLQFDGFAQENGFQPNPLGQPLSASGYFNGKLTQALRQSYLQINADQYEQSLLADPHNACNCYGDATHVFVPNHPFDIHLVWIGFDQRVGHLPFTARLRSGYGWSHDGYGVVPLPNTAFANQAFSASVNPNDPSLIGIGVPTISDTLIGGTLTSKSIRLMRDHHGRDTAFNASFDRQRQWFSLPHHIDTTTTRLSISKVFGPRAASYIAYTIANTSDDYGAQQRIAYTPQIPTSSQTGLTYPGFAAFEGFATNRGLTEGYVYTPSPDFNVALTATENDDSPTPIPGVFGQAPVNIGAEMRLRLRAHLLLDIARSYYFNFGTLRWSPQFSVLLGS